jgi:UPF0042 nucleotide-binding protein
MDQEKNIVASDASSSEGRDRTRVVLVTGLSGAGRSSALRAFEDMGYEAVDNLPLALLPSLLGLADDNPEHDPAHAVAVGIDTRTRAFRPDRFHDGVARLRERPDLLVSVVYLDCASEVLARRFTETRRRHPMAVDRPVVDGILRERGAMASVRAQADYVFDTTDLTPAELKQLISQTFATPADDRMTITLSSFAFPRGLPRDADLVFDVRFLQNPHYVPELKPLTGRDAAVRAFIEKDAAFAPFLEKIQDLITSLLPHYQREGKSYLTIAFGCTGGRHRSVALAECMAAYLKEQGFRVTLVHRELDRLDDLSQWRGASVTDPPQALKESR